MEGINHPTAQAAKDVSAPSDSVLEQLNQKMLFELVERCPFGIYIVDSSFRIATMNQRSQEGAFINVRPVIGRPFDEAIRILWPEPVAAELIFYFRHTLDSGESFYSKDFVRPRSDIAQLQSYEWELHRFRQPDGQFSVVCYYYDSTELRKAQQALRESNERFGLMADAIPQIVWVTDGEGEMKFFNRQWWNYVGTAQEPKTAAEVAGYFVHPDDRRRTLEAFEKARRTGNPFKVEHRVRGADSHYRWFLVRANPHRDHSTGRIIRWFGSSTDIDDHKQIEEALRTAEERDSFLLALSDAIRPLRNPEAIKESACRALGEHLRVNRAFYAEVDADDWIVEGGYTRGVERLRQGRYTAAIYGYRVMNTYRAGQNIVFGDTRTDPGLAPAERNAHVAIEILGAVGVPLLKEGKLVAILAVHTAEPRNWKEEEIALVKETVERTWASVERARAEAALVEAERQSRTILNSISDGFFAIDREWHFKFINRAGENILKRDSRELVGAGIWDEYPALIGTSFDTTYRYVMQTGEPSNTVARYPDDDRFYDVSVYPYAEGISVYFRDSPSRSELKRRN